MESTSHPREDWNKGRLVGQKPPSDRRISGRSGSTCKIATRFVTWHFQRGHRQQTAGLRPGQPACARCHPGNQILPHTVVIQHRTQRPVEFELTEPTRPIRAATSTSSRAGLRVHPMSPRGSASASCITGWKPLVLIPRTDTNPSHSAAC